MFIYNSSLFTPTKSDSMIFQKLGLSYYEDKAFEAIIRQEITVKQLIKKTNIPAGKIYSVLKSLSSRGLISHTDTRPKKFFTNNPAKAVAGLIDDKLEENEEIISKARFLVNSISRKEEDYFFKIGTTREENREMQLKIFREAKTEVLQILNSKHKPSMNRAQKDDWEKEIENAVHRGVKFRALYHHSTKIPENILLLEKKRQISDS
jgi:sugar-specific transcriptional regulator TrmB